MWYARAVDRSLGSLAALVLVAMIVFGVTGCVSDRGAVASKGVEGTVAAGGAATSFATSTTVASPPVAADNPAGLAAQISEAERAIRDPSTPAPVLAPAGQTQQVVYGRLSVRQEWQAEVTALVPPDLRPIVEANLTAVTELARQAAADVVANGGSSKGPPQWRIVAPLPPGELLGAYRAAEAATGMPWQYLAAIHFVETRMGRIRGNSVAGAQGPMQFIPSTWEIYGAGGDINNTHDAVLAAARLLRANGAPSDVGSALYSYNPSNRYVRAVTIYADQMKADERAYLGYYQWQVYYGGRLLPEGYGS